MARLRRADGQDRTLFPSSAAESFGLVQGHGNPLPTSVEKQRAGESGGRIQSLGTGKRVGDMAEELVSARLSGMAVDLMMLCRRRLYWQGGRDDLLAAAGPTEQEHQCRIGGGSKTMAQRRHQRRRADQSWDVSIPGRWGPMTQNQEGVPRSATRRRRGERDCQPAWAAS